MKINIATIKQQAQGHEADLLVAAGLSSDLFRNGKSQACPLCPSSTDSYWWIDKKKSFGCRKCGGGDWLTLLNNWQMAPMSSTIRWCADELGLSNASDEEKKKLAAKAKRRMQISKARADLEDDNRYWDYHVGFEVDDLLYLMEQRGGKRMVGLEEYSQMHRVIAVMTERMKQINESTSIDKARSVLDSLAPWSGEIDSDVQAWVWEVNRLNVFPWVEKDFCPLVVRQMLIEKKSKAFMRQAIKYLNTLKLPSPAEVTYQRNSPIPKELWDMATEGHKALLDKEYPKEAA